MGSGRGDRIKGSPASTHRTAHAASVSHPSGAWLRALLENSSDVICVLGAEGTFLYVSPAVERLLGYLPEDLIGTSSFDYVGTEDVAFVAESFAELVSTPGVHTPVEFRARAADGSLRHVEAIPNNQLGNPVLTGVVVTFRDLTERVRAEEETRFHARLLDAVGQAVIATDMQGSISYWNKAAEELYGWSAEEAAGRSVLEAVLPKQRLDQREEILRGLREGRNWSGEFEQRRKDGTLFPAMVTITAALDELGHLVGIIGVSTDITKQKAAEEKLEWLSRRHELILNSAGEGIYGLDRVGTATFVNPTAAALTGFEPEELIGEDLHDIMHHSYPDGTHYSQNECRIYAALWDGQVHRVDDEVFWRKDGTSFPVEYTSTPILEGDEITGAVVTFREITERKEAEERLREAEARYRTLVERIPAIVYVDEAGEPSRTSYLSPQHEMILGYTPEESLKDPDHWVKIMHPDDRESVLTEARRTDETGEPFRAEYRQFAKDGRVVWLRDEADLVRDEKGKPLYWLGVQTDVTERKALEETLRRQALYDRLTGLPNRQLLMDRLGQFLERTRRRKKLKVAVFFMDLNGFKIINDSLGHAAGDLLLTEVTKRLKRSLRREDTLARFGGDELVLLKEVERLDEATRIAERIVEALETPFLLEGRELFTSMSIGIALGNARNKRPDNLIRDADMAMYQAKQESSGYKVFDPAMNVRARSRLTLENDLRRALEAKEFVLHYQPMTALRTGGITEFEALARWKRPGRGLLAPEEFISLAEETGLIISLGRWVLKAACCQAKKWQQRYPASPPLSISVNLSTRQLHDPGIVCDVADILEEVGLNPASLILEITESALVEQPVDTSEKLRELRDLGVGLAIDDFGTGYSSLSRLKHLPITRLKIDRMFVGGLNADPTNYSIVMATAMLGHALGIEVVAEGVETIEEVEAVRTLKCDIGQGYYWSTPCTTEQAAVVLASNSA